MCECQVKAVRGPEESMMMAPQSMMEGAGKAARQKQAGERINKIRTGGFRRGRGSEGVCVGGVWGASEPYQIA